MQKITTIASVRSVPRKSQVRARTSLTFALPSAVLFLGCSSAVADDAVAVAPNHYKVEFENDKVRVIRITYAPGEESAMHEHKDAVVVNLGTYSVQFTAADGTSPPPEQAAAGTFQWSPAQMHASKNVGNTRAEALLIELKN